MSRNRIVRNTAINLFGQGIPLLIGVAAMPSIVHGLGSERLGLLGLGWVVLGYFNLFDLGMSRAASRFIADAIGRNDQESIPGYAWSAVTMQAVVGLLGSVLLFSLARPLPALLHVAPALVPEAVATFRILAIAVPIVLVAASFRGVLEAARRFDLVNTVNIPGSALNFLIPLAGALAGWPLVTIIWLLLAGRAVTLIAYFVLAARLFPALVSPAASRTTIRTLLPFGAWTTVSNVLSPIVDQLDRLFLGAFAGMASVGFYTAPQEIVLRLRVLPTALATTLFPEFSTLGSPGGLERARRYYAVAIRFLALALAPMTLVLVIMGPDLLRWWVSAEMAERSGTALRFLAIGILANAVAYVPFAFLHGANRPDLPARFHLLEVPIFLILAAVLMPRFGVTGAGAVWAIRAWLDAGLLLAGAKRTGAVGAEPVFGGGTWAWALVLAATVAAGFLPMVAGLDLSARAAFTAVSCVLIAAAGWFGLLRSEDRVRVSGAF